jgi:hypothetical protein
LDRLSDIPGVSVHRIAILVAGARHILAPLGCPDRCIREQDNLDDSTACPQADPSNSRPEALLSFQQLSCLPSVNEPLRFPLAPNQQQRLTSGKGRHGLQVV